MQISFEMKMSKDFHKKVFEGENAIASFLTPQSLGLTPLVELSETLNQFKKDKVRIFIKLLSFVPLLNIKSLPAWEMLNGIDKNSLSRIKHLVEYSSGNTVLSLTILSKYFGIENVHAIITPDIPEHKKRLLRLVGTDLMVSHGKSCPGVHDKDGGVYEAKIMGKKKGWYNLCQYLNENSLLASENYIGHELWDQLGERLTILVSSMGTSGTILGAGRFIKNKNKNVYVIGASIARGSSIPGPRGEDDLSKLGFDWQSVVDKTFPVDTFSAFKSSLDLIRAGLFVGPSSGMQLHTINRILKDLKKKNQLDQYRNKDGEVLIAFIAGDTMFSYIDDYFKVLPKKYFKKDKNLK